MRGSAGGAGLTKNMDAPQARHPGRRSRSGIHASQMAGRVGGELSGLSAFSLLSVVAKFPIEPKDRPVPTFPSRFVVEKQKGTQDIGMRL
jgi:hypothetical protein